MCGWSTWWTARFRADDRSLMAVSEFPDLRAKFPVLWSREFAPKQLILLRE
jgi:hypothetical protein